MNTMARLAAAAGAEKKDNPAKTMMDFLEARKGQIQSALPAHLSADRLMRLVLTECRKNPDLIKCTQSSMFLAVMQAASLGLQVGVMGQAYLLPYKNNKKNIWEAQLIPGYKGLLALARQSGDVRAVETNIVYEKDEFELVLGLETKCVHKPYLMGDRGKPVLVYAVAQFKGGGNHFEWMTMADIQRVRAKSKSGNSGPWATDFAQMVRKTIIRRILNYLPMSVELQNAITLEEANEKGASVVIDGDSFVVDGDTEEQTAPALENSDGDYIPGDEWTTSPEEVAAIKAAEMAGNNG